MIETVIEVDCGTCGFVGDVEVWEDQLAEAWGYTCPNCATTHENTMEPDYDDGYDDYL